MKYFEIEGTYKTPHIVLDSKNRKVQISGRSIPVDVDTFYQPLLDKIDDFVSSISMKEVEIVFDLEYFNLASYKRLLFIVYRFLNDYQLKNHLKIYWYYQRKDIDVLEKGEDFSSMLKLPIQLVERQKSMMRA